MATRKPLTIAFTSGKGGVGKTMLAANFGWVCSQIAKTAIIDLDFQNQGCTGLFAPYIKFATGDAFTNIVNPQSHEINGLNKVAAQLYFCPAVSWKHRPSHKKIAQEVNKINFPNYLQIFITNLTEKHGFEIVVIDCHGGIDPVSVSAFQISNYTLMVTEADSVTFAGTLELLRYYENKSTDKGRRFPSRSIAKNQREVKVDSDVTKDHSDVKFVVNRLPGKYKKRDLDRIYQPYLIKKLGIFTSIKSIFCYVPSEELLADSFGEYPFYVELASRSIFSNKIHYMVYSLMKERIDDFTAYSRIRKFRSDRYRRKIENIVTSNEYKNTQSVVFFAGWSSTCYAVGVVTLIPIIGALYLFEKQTLAFTRDLNMWPMKEVLVSIGGGVLVVLTWYFFRSAFGLMFIYISRHKFQKALFRALEKKLTFLQRLSLAKLLLLRMGTSFAAVGLIFYVILVIIGFAGVFYGL